MTVSYTLHLASFPPRDPKRFTDEPPVGCQLQTQDVRSKKRCEQVPRDTGRSDQDSGAGDDREGSDCSSLYLISGGCRSSVEWNQGLPPVGDQPGYQVHILRVVEKTLHGPLRPAAIRGLGLHTGLSRYCYSHGSHLSSPDGSGQTPTLPRKCYLLYNFVSRHKQDTATTQGESQRSARRLSIRTECWDSSEVSSPSCSSP